MDATPRQNSPSPSPTARKEQPYFKVSSRFESEMKEANEMLRESKQLRVNTTTRPPKTVTFAPATVEHEVGGGGGDDKNGRWNSGAAAGLQAFRNACGALYQAVLRLVCRIQEVLVACNFDATRRVLPKVTSVNRYLLLKLEPGQDDKILSQVITEAVLDLYDAWCENVEEPLVQRAEEIASWFRTTEGRQVTDPCVYEGMKDYINHMVRENSIQILKLCYSQLD
jgi:hypothetical protein